MTWRSKAKCAGRTDEWFPRNEAESERAKKICRTCPVQRICLSEALEHDLALVRAGGHDDKRLWGVWAATTRGERWQLVEERLRGE